MENCLPEPYTDRKVSSLGWLLGCVVLCYLQKFREKMSQAAEFGVRFVMIGGFLGAGKTTTVARLARHWLGQGLRVAVVTNDQAPDLVDTRTLQAAGLPVGEVPGACFCCKFDDLVNTASRLWEQVRPQVILAEPVGSCTDLVATVAEPLRRLYPRFQLAPFVVLFKPEHGEKILSGQGRGFSPKAAYIFHKQLEEADVIALNKIDRLSPEQIQRLEQLVRQHYPDKTLLSISARTGQGFDRLCQVLDQPYPSSRRFMEVDYDIYAEGEAELGWLNCCAQLTSSQGGEFPLDEVLWEFMDLLAARLQSLGEVGHVKASAGWGSELAVANWTSSADPVELSRSSGVHVPGAELTLNARVATDPEQLLRCAREALDELCSHRQLSWQGLRWRSFRPGRPVPTHRFTQP